MNEKTIRIVIIALIVGFVGYIILHFSYKSSIKNEIQVEKYNKIEIDTIKPIQNNYDTIFENLKDGVDNINNHFDTCGVQCLDSALHDFRNKRKLEQG